MRYLEATLLDGTKVVGTFSRLAKIQRYIGQVFRGEKPFNAWKTVSDTLPSGEKSPVREREMFSGAQIRSIREISAPTPGAAGVPEIARGPRGRWTAPADIAIEGVSPGQVFPKHREASWLYDYVIISTDGTVEKRLRLDTMDVESFDASATPAPLPDADDDLGDGDSDES